MNQNEFDYNMSIEISVIIAAYNRSDFLRKSLLSLNDQSFRPNEVIIVDDGSDIDLAEAICDLTGKIHFGIIIVRQPYQGFRLAKSKNNGIKQATGDYLIFNDQDIIQTPDYLRTFIKHRKPGQFLVAYPVRLTEAQTRLVTEETVQTGQVEAIVTPDQRKKIRKQFIKDGVEYYFKKILHTNGHKPKLRGGVFGIHKDDLLKVDGFDEQFQGWGNEDDDLGRRLYRAGITGRNPFRDQFPIHLWHPPHHEGGRRDNKQYYHDRIKAIRDGMIRATNGLSNPLGDDKIEIIRIK